MHAFNALTVCDSALAFISCSAGSQDQPEVSKLGFYSSFLGMHKVLHMCMAFYIHSSILELFEAHYYILRSSF